MRKLDPSKKDRWIWSVDVKGYRIRAFVLAYSHLCGFGLYLGHRFSQPHPPAIRFSSAKHRADFSSTARMHCPGPLSHAIHDRPTFLCPSSQHSSATLISVLQPVRFSYDPQCPSATRHKIHDSQRTTSTS
ncbi:cysteine proteinases superfamily protein [Striga asiatica]|uniref:Cysteine proteinases superfamily protein n=1 Tax=Striga asiatica TaxID=4170 RepID=A0A5A7NYR8_STRAF|nr:cysteine proteinases superfamily protein [Striga asiatica]